MTPPIIAGIAIEPALDELLRLYDEFPEDVREFGAAFTARTSPFISDAAIALAEAIDQDPIGTFLRIIDEVDRRPFGQANPALVAWRQRVIHERRQRPRLDVAAAYECQALESELAGEANSAELARAAAHAVLVRSPGRRTG
jgi:hypothetical protein